MNGTYPCYYTGKCYITELNDDYYNDTRFRNYINFAINTLTTIIASFIIVYRSSKAMKMYRWFLLNITIWSYIWDFNMTLFFVPVFLFPSPTVCSLGLAKDIFGISPLATAVPFSFLILTLAGCDAALACALYYRYKLLSNSSTVIFTKKYFLIGMLLFHFVSGLPPLIASLFGFLDKALDPDYWFDYIKREFPLTWVLDFCIFKHNINHSMCSCGGVVIGTTGTNIMLSAILTELVLYFLLIIFGPLYIYYCLRKRSKMITHKTYDHERKLILSLSMQSIIPLVCLVMPYIYAIIEIIFDIDKPLLVTIFVQLSTLHSFFNALVMILILKPYRKAVTNTIFPKCFKNRIGITSNYLESLNNGLIIQVKPEILKLRRLTIRQIQFRRLSRPI